MSSRLPLLLGAHSSATFFFCGEVYIVVYWFWASGDLVDSSNVWLASSDGAGCVLLSIICDQVVKLAQHI